MVGGLPRSMKGEWVSNRRPKRAVEGEKGRVRSVKDSPFASGFEGDDLTTKVSERGRSSDALD